MSDEYNVKLLVKEANLNAISINSANVNSHNKKYSGFKALLKDNIPESLADYNGNAYDISSVFHDTNWSSTDNTKTPSTNSSQSNQKFSQIETNTNLELYKNARLVPHEDASGTTHKLWTVYDDASNNLLEHMINYKFDNSGSYLPILTYYNGSAYVESSMFSDPLWWLIDYENHAISFFNTDSVLNGGTVNISAGSANPPKLTFYRYIGKTKVNNKLSVEGDISCNEVIVSGTTLTSKLGVIDASYSDLSGVVTANIASIATLDNEKAPINNPTFTGATHIFGSTSVDNTTVDILASDSTIARIRVMGNSQGTGDVFVGQSTTYGGGIEYNGDNSPTSTGAELDYFNLYRMDNGTKYWTAKNFYNNNNWIFRGDLQIDGGNIKDSGGNTTITMNNGNVGIGTTDPSCNLHVFGYLMSRIKTQCNQGYYGTDNCFLSLNSRWTDSADNTQGFYKYNSISWYGGTDKSSNNAKLHFQYLSGTPGAFNSGDSIPLMTIMGNGDVGIGTSYPEAKLDIQGSNDVCLRLRGYGGPGDTQGKTGIAFHIVQRTSNSYPLSTHKPYAEIIAEEYGTGNTQGNLLFKIKQSSGYDTAPTTAMILDYNGNVGIGTTTPDIRLHTKTIKEIYNNNQNIITTNWGTVGDPDISDTDFDISSLFGNTTVISGNNNFTHNYDANDSSVNSNADDKIDKIKDGVFNGQNVRVWASENNDTGNDWDGGWNITYDGVSATKTYIYYLYGKCTRNGTDSAIWYFGTSNNSSYGVKPMDSSSWYSNPYFVTIDADSNMPLDVWCIAIGILFPYDHSNTNYTQISGIYRLDTYDKIATPGNTSSIRGSWKFLDANVTKIRMRNYLYYDSAPPSTSTNIEWYKPTIICAEHLGLNSNDVYNLSVTDIINLGDYINVAGDILKLESDNASFVFKDWQYDSNSTNTTFKVDDEGFKIWNNDKSNDMQFGTNNTTVMTINSQGKVGIGSKSSDHLLEIKEAPHEIYNLFKCSTINDNGSYHVISYRYSGHVRMSSWYKSDDMGRGTGTFHVSTDNNTVCFAGRPYSSGNPKYVIGFKTVADEYINNFTGQATEHPSNAAHLNNAVLTIDYSGNVGIGTTSPGYPLEVNGSKNDTITSGYQLANDGPTSWSSGSTDISLKTSNHIWSQGAVFATSDQRIKENIADVPDNLSLQTLRDINCTYYEYKDKISKGNDKTIGFIAQQVKEHMPMAVSIKKDIIPDEMRQLSDYSWNQIADASDNYDSSNNQYKLTIHDLSDNSGNTLYRFYVSNDPSGNDELRKEIKSLENDPKSFVFDQSWNNVFLYGKEVDDLHILDKNKLFALNFSATQEIDRIQQSQQQIINDQQTTINTLQSTLAALEARIAALENP